MNGLAETPFARPSLAPSAFSAVLTFRKPSIGWPFRSDMDFRQQFHAIREHRAERRVKANWEDWLTTWTSKESHLKILYCLLGEGKRVALSSYSDDKARLVAIHRTAIKVGDRMYDSEEDVYAELLAELASIGLFWPRLRSREASSVLASSLPQPTRTDSSLVHPVEVVPSEPDTFES